MYDDRMATEIIILEKESTFLKQLKGCPHLSVITHSDMLQWEVLRSGNPDIKLLPE